MPEVFGGAHLSQIENALSGVDVIPIYVPNGPTQPGPYNPFNPNDPFGMGGITRGVKIKARC
jgi:hypothetical protein